LIDWGRKEGREEGMSDALKEAPEHNRFEGSRFRDGDIERIT